LPTCSVFPKKIAVISGSFSPPSNAGYRHNHKWLLLLDNLDNRDDFAFIRQLVPPQSNGHVLLTHASGHRFLCHVLMVPSMSTDESALFLLRRAKIIDEQAPLNDASPANYAQAKHIAQEVDGFPSSRSSGSLY